MNKLLQIKPAIYLLIHISGIILSILISIIWSKIVPESIEVLGVTFTIIGTIGGYLFWIFLILAGFQNIDLKNGLDGNLKKSIVLLSSILIINVMLVIIFLLESSDEKESISNLIVILSSGFLTYAFFEITIILTKKVRFYDGKTQPGIWNYFVTLLTLSIYPFGLLMLHSHLSLILKNQKIIEK